MSTKVYTIIPLCDISSKGKRNVPRQILKLVNQQLQFLIQTIYKFCNKNKFKKFKEGYFSCSILSSLFC